MHDLMKQSDQSDIQPAYLDTWADIKIRMFKIEKNDGK